MQVKTITAGLSGLNRWLKTTPKWKSKAVIACRELGNHRPPQSPSTKRPGESATNAGPSRPWKRIGKFSRMAQLPSLTLIPMFAHIVPTATLERQIGTGTPSCRNVVTNVVANLVICINAPNVHIPAVGCELIAPLARMRNRFTHPTGWCIVIYFISNALTANLHSIACAYADDA
jgi:hypothetical protein